MQDRARRVAAAQLSHARTFFQVPLPLEVSVFFHVVMRRHATREIVQVN
jgi:hypothetical protein